MNNKLISEFVLKASRATYASGDASLRQKQNDGSTTIQYIEGDFSYHDNYFGGEPYGGREVVFYQENPVWMMAYYGWVETGQDLNEVYKFLASALSNSTPDMPQRGPIEFIQEDWRYENKLEGDFDRFKGIEKITYKGTQVYEAWYMGGMVDKKN